MANIEATIAKVFEELLKTGGIKKEEIKTITFERAEYIVKRFNGYASFFRKYPMGHTGPEGESNWIGTYELIVKGSNLSLGGRIEL